jgi:hypothetical protein
LRLYLSVDVVGSTALKQRISKAEKLSGEAPAPAEPWFSPIVQFYREIEQRFFQEWQQYEQKISAKHLWPAGPSPEFWKGAGDELIYTKRLDDHREALVCIQAWMRAINEYRRTFKKNNPTLDLKSTAWIAGFPVHNAEVFFRQKATASEVGTGDGDPIYSNLSLLQKFYDGDTSITRDFIGPSIDTGFRLATLASPRKLVVSVDLALILAHTIPKQGAQFAKDFHPKLQIHYDGQISLKGVLGGAPYPVFWLDMAAEDELSKATDDLTGREPLDCQKVADFCEKFIGENPSFLTIPYIVSDKVEPLFQTVPERHTERIAALKAYWENETAKRGAEEKAALEEDEEQATDISQAIQDSILAIFKRQDDAGSSKVKSAALKSKSVQTKSKLKSVKKKAKSKSIPSPKKSKRR